jgi:hypothetical protein
MPPGKNWRHVLKHLFGSRVSIALIAGALSGAGLAGVLALHTPSRYVSSTVVRIPPSRSIRDLRVMTLSRGSLHDVIEKEGLYGRLLARLPMEDVVDRMRRDVEIQSLNAPDLCAIRFVYEDATKVKRVTRDLLDKISVPGMAVINPPDLPARSEHPTRPEITGMGFVGGLLVALLAIGVWRSSRIRLSSAAALVGGILAAVISFALPGTYVSMARMAVSSVPPLDRVAASNYWMSVSHRALGADSLASIAASPSLSISKDPGKPMPQVIQELQRRIDVQPVSSDEFSIAVTYNDPAKAQAINRELIVRLTEEEFSLYRRSLAISNEPPGEPARMYSRPTIREGRGRLRTGIEGLDVGNMPGKTNPQDSSEELLSRGFPSGTLPERETLLSPMPAPVPVRPHFIPEPVEALPPGLPRLQVVTPPDLPDTPISPNRLIVTLAGIVAGLSLGALSSTRPGTTANSELSG